MARTEFRLQYIDRPLLLPVNIQETVHFGLWASGSQIAITHGSSTATLRDRDGTLLATGTVSDDGDGIKAQFTVPAGTAIGSGYSVIWGADVGGDAVTIRQAAVVTEYPLLPPLHASAWTQKHPNDTNYPSGQTDFGVQLTEAWNELLWDLSNHTRGLEAEIWDDSKLRPILWSKWGRIVFRLLSTNVGQGRHATQAEYYEAREKEQWQSLVLDYDTDGDGDRDVVNEHPASPSFPPPLRGF